MRGRWIENILKLVLAGNGPVYKYPGRNSNKFEPKQDWLLSLTTEICDWNICTPKKIFVAKRKK